MRNKKKWSGWFVPLERGKRSGPLTWAWVEVSENKIAQIQTVPRKNSRSTNRTKLIVSVPALCGNAVLRNRFRRMIRGFLIRRGLFDQISQSKGLWIRLSAHHRLSRQITLEEWLPLLEKVQAYVVAQLK